MELSKYVKNAAFAATLGAILGGGIYYSNKIGYNETKKLVDQGHTETCIRQHYKDLPPITRVICYYGIEKALKENQNKDCSNLHDRGYFFRQ